MKSTSCKEIAEDLLAQCLAGAPPRDLPRALGEEPCGTALFRILVEGLADRFEPALCDVYARLFAQAVAYVIEGANPGALVARYERVRRIRPVAGNPRRVFVLSRITLGADVAVTSVLLAAVKERFPNAAIVLVGPEKNFELFAGDPRITHGPVEYRRGGLRERLAVWEDLKSLLSDRASVVIDPDSRLTQLGLLPVCEEERYHLFESRAYGGDTDCTLPELASAWAFETFGVSGARPYLALPASSQKAPDIAVSLGVGDNSAKRIPDPFEPELLSLLSATGGTLLVDRGAGGEEARRVEYAIERSGVEATFWDGSFAGFAALIAGSRLYVGYDSAGQHVAAACGVPLISIFAGFPVPRMFERWRPAGPGCTAIRVDRPYVTDVLARVKEALAVVPGFPASMAKVLD
ncbi:MAG TPA: glycosyltransferase family 9 protein [Bryobacteraceae bacterium]|nr:glycosyltransferase family 9 protein [Bryobacteraceae bacterium]